MIRHFLLLLLLALCAVRADVPEYVRTFWEANYDVLNEKIATFDSLQSVEGVIQEATLTPNAHPMAHILDTDRNPYDIVVRRTEALIEHLTVMPGSHKYVAVTSGHHTWPVGNLVLIDTHIEDDNGMAQIQRITNPDFNFIRDQGDPFPSVWKVWVGDHYHYLTTPWPLSEAFFIAPLGSGKNVKEVLLVDAFGNRVVLFAGRHLPPRHPIPLRPRLKPPVTNPSGEHVRLSLFTAAGRIITTRIFDGNRSRIRIDLSNAVDAPGMYYVGLTSGRCSNTKRLVFCNP